MKPSDRSLAEAILRTLPRHCLVVLAFHRVGDDLPPWHFGTRPSDLVRTVTSFARAVEPVSLTALGNGPIRGRRLAVTFDDGYADNATVAAPLLRGLGIPAAFFLPTQCVEDGFVPWPDLAYGRLLRLSDERLFLLAHRLAPRRRFDTPVDAAHAIVHALKLVDAARRDRLIRALPPEQDGVGGPMTWAEAGGLLADGFDVGSHGHTHAVLPSLDDAALERELRESKRLIEARLGETCDLIAYPDNRVDERVAAAAARAGYRVGLCGGQTFNVGMYPSLSVRRISGEESRAVVVAARLRGLPHRRSRRPVPFARVASWYETEREVEYGFRTQARLVARAMSGVPLAEVIDAGCGSGSLMPTLRGIGVRHVVGVDAEPAMIEAARRTWPAESWARGDICRLPFPRDHFDAAVSLGVLEYVERPAVAVRELARVVAPGANVIVTVPQRYSPNDIMFRVVSLVRPGIREPSVPLGAAELRRLFMRAGLSVVELRATNFFVFPFDMLFKTLSRRIAEALDPRGHLGSVRWVGAQLFVHARKEQPRSAVWLAPALPTGTSFLDREFESLRELGVPVRAAAPQLGPAAAVTFVRHPITSTRIAFEVQRNKARRDRERGRLGYLLLTLRGLTLARELEQSRSRVHATFADGVGTVAYVAARIAGVPYTFTAHSPYSLWQASCLLQRQAEEAEVVVCVSRDMQRRIGALAPLSRRVIVRCVGPSVDAIPSRRESGLFVAVGNLIPHKGFSTAIEAVALVVGQGYRVRLDIIGDGPERARLTQQITDFGLREYVHLAGRLSNTETLGRIATAVGLLAPCEVQPDGDRDGLPVSILDAAACGVPAIATAVSGIPEFVVDGKTGVLVPQRDPHALAAAIVLLVGDDDLVRQLGEGAAGRLRERHDARREPAKLARLWFG